MSAVINDTRIENIDTPFGSKIIKYRKNKVKILYSPTKASSGSDWELCTSRDNNLKQSANTSRLSAIWIKTGRHVGLKRPQILIMTSNSLSSFRAFKSLSISY
jgi:hypothetical protein